MEKKKVLVFYKQLNDEYCRAIENIGMQPISFFSEGGSFEDFKITPYLKYKNILRRLFFGDKMSLQREYKKHTEGQFIRRIKKIAHKYSKIDYALFFRGDYYPEVVLDVSRSISEKMITYQFDGMSICQDLLPNKNKFDRIFTFNQEDMDAYHFLPLTNCWFPDEKKIANPTIEKDVFYVGVGTPDRIDKAKKLGEYCSENGLFPDMLLTVPPHISEEKNGGGCKSLAFRCLL